jgi:hypothetical protein
MVAKPLLGGRFYTSGGTMGRDHPYARQRLWQAVEALVGDGTVRERPGVARDMLLHLQPEQVPAHLRPEYLALMEALNDRAVRLGHEQFSRIITRRPKSGDMAKTILRLYIDARGGV